MSDESFFTRDGPLFTPTAMAKGPWKGDSMHGRLIVGLLAHEIEARHGSADYLPARLTVDLYRLPSMAQVEVVTRVVKDGYRIKVIDAEFIQEGVSSGRASCQLLRRGDNPQNLPAAVAKWDAPKPDDLPRAKLGVWDVRSIDRDRALGSRRIWARDLRDMVAGVVISPFVRVAALADMVSPMANGHPEGLKFINSDVTVYLTREPVSDWIGFDVIDHSAADGVATGTCRVYDEDGPVGVAACTALAQAKAPEKPTGR